MFIRATKQIAAEYNEFVENKFETITEENPEQIWKELVRTQGKPMEKIYKKKVMK